jgi:hypothetical protein
MATAFLGYEHSPKSLNSYLFENINLSIMDEYLLMFQIFMIFGKRYYSNNVDNNKDINNKNLGTLLILLKNKIHYEKIYTELHLNVTRDKMSKEIKNKQGIYMVLNLVTENYYIGSASTNKFMSRFTRHLIYLSGSKLVKNSILKYSLPNFAFIILEFYPEIINRTNNKELLALETKYIKTVSHACDTVTEAGNPFRRRRNGKLEKNV